MAKTTTKKPKNPMAALLGKGMQSGAGMGPPAFGMQSGLGMGPPAPGFATGPGMGPMPLASGPLTGPPMPQSLLSPSLRAMQGAGPVSPEMTAGMTNARTQGLLREKMQEPGPMPGMTPPAAGPPAPGLAAMMPPPMPLGGQQGMTPDQRAMIDQFTGKRVHKGMGGQQLGLQGVSPALKYMLYSMQNRRHKGMGGQEIY